MMLLRVTLPGVPGLLGLGPPDGGLQRGEPHPLHVRVHGAEGAEALDRQGLQERHIGR